MAVKIRLTRVGKKRQPAYRVVVADSRSPRDGRYIEQIGRYDPTVEPSIVEIDNERAEYWMTRGAKPSSQVKKLLEISGSLEARPIKDRRVHVVAAAAEAAAAEAAVATPAATPGAEAAEPATGEGVTVMTVDSDPGMTTDDTDDKVVDMTDDVPAEAGAVDAGDEEPS